MVGKAQSGRLKVECDLCNIGTMWIPESPTEAQTHLQKTGWINVVVMADRMDICPTCQVVARALQIADAAVAVNPNAYPKAYEEPAS